MKARFVEGAYPSINIALEPETVEERLLLRVFIRQADEPNGREGQTCGIRIGSYGFDGRPGGITHASIVQGPRHEPPKEPEPEPSAPVALKLVA